MKYIVFLLLALFIAAIVVLAWYSDKKAREYESALRDKKD